MWKIYPETHHLFKSSWGEKKENGGKEIVKDNLKKISHSWGNTKSWVKNTLVK